MTASCEPIQLNALRLVFDESFYLSCYREAIPHDADPFEHFLTTGFDRGYKPNERIDPLVSIIENPGIEREALISEILARSLSSEPQVKLSALLKGRLPPQRIRPMNAVEDDSEANLSSAASYGKKSQIAFRVSDKDYFLRAPAFDFVREELAEDRPFAFARLSHGDWDCLRTFRHYRAGLRRILPQSFSDRSVDLLAARYCDEIHHDEEMYAENFLMELIDDLRTHSVQASFHYGISFKGYPTADNRLFDWSLDTKLHAWDRECLELVSEFFSSQELLFDATVWKRWLISGDLAELPSLLQGRPVILLGADRLSSLGERWQLPWFLHVPIPPSHGYKLRHDLLVTCGGVLAEANKIALRHGTRRPVFLMQGSSFAYWLMVRLWRSNPDVFFFDLGQALHAWFYDIQEIGLLKWGRLYGPTILRNCRLDQYYRNLCVPEPVAESLFGALRPRR